MGAKLSNEPKMDPHTYHLEELAIASNPDDPRRIMPPIQKGHQRILDVGCGGGQTLIAGDLALDAVAVGIDIEHSALSLGRQLSNRIHFVCGKGEALPFKDDCFDLVISRVALPYMHVQSALSEMSRVLKPGGDLWIVLHPSRMIIKEMVKNITVFNFRGALYQLYVLINGMTLHLFNKQFPLPLGGSRYESFQTSSVITRILQAEGFESIKISDDRFFVATGKKFHQHRPDTTRTLVK